MSQVNFNNIQLHCPVRGYLKQSKKTKNGLSNTEEYYRINAINYLISKNYPKEHILIEPIIKKFGNSGRNSFRCDFAVLDIPASLIDRNNIDEVLEHALILGEVKRDNSNVDYVEKTQVEPMLDFSKNISTLGIYWDNIEQRVFWQEVNNGRKMIHSGPIAILPEYLHSISSNKSLTYKDLIPAKSLISIFERIEDILHKASFGPESRYEMILQILLAKIFDEHAFETRTSLPVNFQDYRAQGLSESQAKKAFEELVGKGVRYYENHLPKKISTEVKYNGFTVFEIAEVIAPIKILDAKRSVIQTFYMKFAKQLYKWDLAQYFTPPSITDFLIDIINPQFGEKILDPAAGSADFLVAAFKKGRNFNPGFADNIYGIDNSENAIQVAVLNMVLNGDGKSNLMKEDSLENIEKHEESYDIVTCNPPFGSKIVEKRKEVLSKFSLAKDSSGNILEKQETGVLFAEAVIRFCRKGGRYLIILPNGYLGNTSEKFKELRKYILKTSKIVSIISLPRFAFKSSGADVSASVIVAERRKTDLNNIVDCEDYPISIQIVNKLGWSAGDSNGKIQYKRNNETGTIETDEYGEPIVDSEFEQIIEGIRSSDASIANNWLNDSITPNNEYSIEEKYTWCIKYSEIANDPFFTLDPKRYSYKAKENLNSITNKPHFILKDIVEIIPEGFDKDGEKVTKQNSKTYQYVDISSMQYGTYTPTPMHGWELPSRAKHFAEEGDIYVGSIWGSVSKWIYIGKDIHNVIVTNGAFRLRLLEGCEEYLTDVLSYIQSESWAVQLRSLARGSDGLAEIQKHDLLNVCIPKLTNKQKETLSPYIKLLKSGRISLKEVISQKPEDFSIPDIEKRYSHINLI